MSAEVRAMVGLRFPPKPYFQNANECMSRTQVILPLLNQGEWTLNPIQDGHFWGCSRMGGDQKGSPP